MESTLQKPASSPPGLHPKPRTIVYWIVTALFCLQMSFTAYAQLRLPQVAEAFTHLGFPAYFRVELSWAKLLGVVLILAPRAGAAQGVGLRRLRHQSRLGAHRPPRGGRWPGGVGLGGGHRLCSGGSRISSGAACRPRGQRLTAS